MSNEISVILSLQTAGALQKLDAFLGKASAGLRTLVREVAEAAAAFEAMRKIEEAVRSAINLEEAMGRLQQRTGLTIPAINELREAAVKVGVPFEDFSRTLTIFGTKIYEAATQGGKMSDLFNEMGVKLVNGSGNLRSTDSILSDVIVKFKTLNVVQQDAIARGLFGRAGYELITVFNQMDESLDKASGKTFIKQEDIQNATEFNVAMRTMGLAIENIFIKVANQLLPTLLRLVDFLNRVGGETYAAEFAFAMLGDTLKGVITVIAVTGTVIYDVVKAIGYFLAQGVDALIDSWETISNIFKAWIQYLKDLADVMIHAAEGIEKGFEIIKLAATGHFKEAKEASDKYDAETLAGMKKLGSDLMGEWDALSGGVKKTWSDAGAYNKLFVDDVKKDWVGVLGFLNQMWNDTPIARPKGAGAQQPSFHVGMSSEDVKNMAAYQQIAQDIYKNNIKLIESDPFQSQLEKARKLLPMMEEQKQNLIIQLAASQATEQAARTEGDKIAARKESVKIQGQLNDLILQEAKLRSQATFSGNVQGQWTKMMEATENFSKDATALLLSPIEGFRQGFSHALDEMLVKGKFSFGTFALGMLAVIRQSFVQMVSDWVVSHIIMKGISIAFHALLTALGWSRVASHTAEEEAKAAAGQAIAWTNVAAMIPVATALAALWATPAALATIASYGGAAAAAPALIALAEGLTLAESVAPREFGGPVQAGKPYIVGEKRPELFVPSQSGVIMPSVPSAAALAGGGSNSDQPNVHNNFQFHFVDSQEQAIKKARANPEWHHMIIDVVNQKAHLIGQRS